MFHSLKKLCCLIIFAVVIIVFVVIGYNHLNNVTVEFLPEYISTDAPDEYILNRFNLSNNKREHILENSENYIVVCINGEITNSCSTQVCDVKIDAKLCESKNVYFKTENRINESPAFYRIDVNETVNDCVYILIDSEFFSSIDDKELLDVLEFTATAKKYSDEKFENVYG